MRVSISHNKTKEQAMQIVDKSFMDFFGGLPGGALQIADQKKSWNGSTLDFSFVAKMAFFKVPITGTAEVTDHDVIVNVDLPAFLTNMIPEAKLRTGIENNVKGLLNA